MQHQESLGTARTLIFNFTFVIEIINIQKTSNFSKNKMLIHKCDGLLGGEGAVRDFSTVTTNLDYKI
jgi:hypothetical protein